MAIEILFPDVANLFGDSLNIAYLKDCLPGEEFVETLFNNKPYFVENSPSIIYLGSMTEVMQRKIIARLMPYKARLRELIEGGTVVLATGNGCEIFATELDYVTEKIKTEGLGLVPLTVKTDLFARYNGKVLGKTGDLKIIGFRSQFGFLYGDNSAFPFLNVERGVGINKQSKLEGYRINNFFGTQLIGPLLPLNPGFCDYLLSLANLTGSPEYRKEADEAYTARLKEFEAENTVF